MLANGSSEQQQSAACRHDKMLSSSCSMSGVSCVCISLKYMGKNMQRHMWVVIFHSLMFNLLFS